jgi:hypothetical protein
MKHLPTLVLSISLALTGCAGIPKPPPGSENDRTFTASTTVDYQDAFRSVARRSTACFGQTGFFTSMNYNVQSDLDAVAKIGRVEVFPVGVFSGEDKDSDRKSYITTIKATERGSEVTTTGPLRNTAYIVNLLSLQWISGKPDCKFQG